MNSSKVKIALIGARVDGQAGVVVDLLRGLSQFEVVCFYDSTPGLRGTAIFGCPVIGCINDITNEEIEKVDYFHICIGDNGARWDIYKKLKQKGANFLTIIHPTAFVSTSAVLGEGCFVGAKAVVQNHCVVGNVCLFNTASIVEHDNKIGNAVHMAPNSTTGGRVKISDIAFIGIGSTILPDVFIGASAFIGAGAVIRKDVPENTTMVGYAAKVHTKNIYQDLPLPDGAGNPT